MPIAAGVLEIVSGALGLLIFVGLLIASIAVGTTAGDITGWIPGMGIAMSTLTIFAVVALATASFAVVGGVFALQRKKWGWALAGSICALVPLFVLGVASVVLTAVSRDEFE